MLLNMWVCCTTFLKNLCFLSKCIVHTSVQSCFGHNFSFVKTFWNTSLCSVILHSRKYTNSSGKPVDNDNSATSFKFIKTSQVFPIFLKSVTSNSTSASETLSWVWTSKLGGSSSSTFVKQFQVWMPSYFDFLCFCVHERWNKHCSEIYRLDMDK